MGLFGKPRTQQTSNRTIELDFVRGIAIIAVMGFHFHSVKTGYWFVSAIEYPLKSFGREGVNLFFTLSGFLVGGLLLKQYSEHGRIDAWRFIIRRIFKIWPAYYVLILFHVFAGRHPTDTFLFQNLTHMQNYLGTSISQTWSLAVEEHFYLFLPALLLIFVRFKVGVNAIIGTLLSICGIVLLARCAVVSNGDVDAAFFQTQYRIDSLLFGVILAAFYWMKPDVYKKFADKKWLLLSMVAVLVAWLVLGTTHIALDESIGFTIQRLVSPLPSCLRSNIRRAFATRCCIAGLHGSACIRMESISGIRWRLRRRHPYPQDRGHARSAACRVVRRTGCAVLHCNRDRLRDHACGRVPVPQDPRCLVPRQTAQGRNGSARGEHSRVLSVSTETAWQAAAPSGFLSPFFR